MNSVPRLGVRSANFWDEATHGVAPRGNVYTTMFPMPSLSGCAFNRSLWQAIGDVAGAEGRAASNLGAASDVFWAPNVSWGIFLSVLALTQCSCLLVPTSCRLTWFGTRDVRAHIERHRALFLAHPPIACVAGGRAQEVPSEAPTVAAEYAVSFLSGFQVRCGVARVARAKF